MIFVVFINILYIRPAETIGLKEQSLHRGWISLKRLRSLSLAVLAPGFWRE